MSLCGNWTFRLRSADGGRWAEFQPSGWEFDYRRKRPGEATLEVSDCVDLGLFDMWCDYLEAWCDNELAARFLLNGVEPQGDGTLQLSAVGLSELLTKRRYETDVALSGSAGALWAQLWARAGVPLGPQIAGGGPTLNLSASCGDTLDDTLDSLGVYLTWAEHQGALYDWLAGDEPTGRPLTPAWVSSFSCDRFGETDGASVANDLLFKYGPNLDNVHRWPGGDVGEDCVLQSGALEFPEITSRQQIVDLANLWGPRLSAPEPVLDSVELDPKNTSIGDLLPGVWHKAMFGPHEGYAFNLAAAEISGVFGCVESVTAGFDQGDSEIRRRILS